MRMKKHLNLKALIAGFKIAFQPKEDTRREYSVTHDVLDTALSVLACMFYKSSSLLRFQRMMKKKVYKSNIETQFGVTQIPSDNQIRAIMGDIPAKAFRPVFSNYLNRLQRGKHLDKFKFMGKYLVALDGTQYHTSEDISCKECLTQKKSNGKTEYSHKALQAIICHPNQKQIIPLMPEPIKKTDGIQKQDCEINAAKRMLPDIRSQHPRMSFIWLADSIYATAPFIQSILSKKEEFIFRIKKGDHKSLYKHLESSEYSSHKTTVGKTTLAYRWYEDVPLNKSTDITVTVLKVFAITIDKDGNKSSTIVGIWATNLTVTKENVAMVTKAARARWRIENQCFNAVKNYGYDLTHNWGHVNGESFNFYIVIMLGFFMHQIFEMTDQLFQLCRKVHVTYRDLWDDLSALFKYILFESWEDMLVHSLKSAGTDPPSIQ